MNKDSFTVPDRPMGFKVTLYKSLVNVVLVVLVVTNL